MSGPSRELVEKAAEALFKRDRPTVNWEERPEYVRDIFREMASVAFSGEVWSSLVEEARAEVREEVERLREALEWIRHQCGVATADDAVRAMNEAYETARAALAGSEASPPEGLDRT